MPHTHSSLVSNTATVALFRQTTNSHAVLGQGGALAIEDAASIAQLLPESTSASEVSDRLQLYESIRYERVTHVQEQTRINGLDEDKRPAGKDFGMRIVIRSELISCCSPRRVHNVAVLPQS